VSYELFEEGTHLTYQTFYSKLSMQDITIRKATLNDMETLLRFEQGVIEFERPFDPTLDDDIHYYDLEKMIVAPHIQLLVAEQSRKIIASGYARIESAARPYLKHDRHAYLGFMYVVPECRGRGINRLIVEQLKIWSAAQGVTELLLEVYAANEGAIRAYEKAGFEQLTIAMRMGLK